MLALISAPERISFQILTSSNTPSKTPYYRRSLSPPTIKSWELVAMVVASANRVVTAIEVPFLYMRAVGTLISTVTAICIHTQDPQSQIPHP